MYPRQPQKKKKNSNRHRKKKKRRYLYTSYRLNNRTVDKDGEAQGSERKTIFPMHS